MRRASSLSLVVALVLLACSASSPSPTTGTPQVPTEPATTTTLPPSVPLAVHVVSVQGDLSPDARERLPAEAGAPIDGYLKAAYAEGPYPRAAFPRAFDSFTPGAAERAARQADLLTNAALGPDLADFRAVRNEAALVVFARDGRPQGASATLAFQGRGRHRAQGEVQVAVSGDLYLVATADGWRIMGYRLDQATATLSDEFAAFVGGTPPAATAPAPVTERSS